MDKIWAYTIQLGRNLWSDCTERPIATLDYTQAVFPYYESYAKDAKCFRELVDHAASVGANTLVINLGEALHFESHPEIAIPGVWTAAELSAEIEHIRSLGMEPVPMLNFSAAHDIWLGKYERMLSTPEYLAVCGDLIDEVCALFKPKYLNIGMDEETWEAQKNYDYATIRNNGCFFKDLAFLLDRCRKNGVRPWMFCDSESRSREEFVAAVGKDVLLSDQQLMFRKKTEDGKRWMEYPDQLAALAREGYDVVPGLNCYRVHRIMEEKLNFVTANFPHERTVGAVVYPYLFCERENFYKLCFEASHARTLILAHRRYFETGEPVQTVEDMSK